MRRGLLLSLAALFAVSCASTGSAPPRSSVRAADAAGAEFAALLRARNEIADTTEFREDLELVYQQILARSRPLDEKIRFPFYAPPPVVDIEAAASIPIPDHPSIQSAVRLFSGDLRNKIQDSLTRSGRYKPQIHRALDEFKLPRGLAYLPVIESAYLPTVTSRAGAYGIWQFMPDTARENGLRVDWWIDERADPELSTRAAAAFLRKLYDRFGDWSLALAAYNGGPNRVGRLLERTGRGSFWEVMDELPRETRGYVPTFYATLLIASDPESYGFTLGTPEHPDDRAIDLRGPVSLKWIAEITGVSEAVLREMNPALRRGAVPPGVHHVHVPAHAAPALLARADRLPEEDAHLKVSTHTVRSGDTLSRVARAVGTNEETLRAMNDLSSGAIRPGQQLYVPVRARELGSLLTHERTSGFFYSVRKGDTLYSIARRNGMSVGELRDLNDLRPDEPIRVGQKLRIAPSRTATGGM